MSDYNSVLVPIASSTQLLTSEKELPLNLKKRYQASIGSLCYLMNCTRPEVAFAVYKLAQFAASSGEEHLHAAKQVLRYVKGTLDAKIIIPTSTQDKKLVGYFNSSWAENVDNSRSTFRYTLIYANIAILWKSRLPKGVSLATIDAEYLATTETIRDVLHVKNLFEWLKLKLPLPVKILGDNLNTNGHVNGTMTTARTSHIQLRVRFVSKQAADGMIRVQGIPTEYHVADLFTKPLSRQVFEKHSRLIALVLSSHICTGCQRSFNSKNTLYDYIRNSHSDKDYPRGMFALLAHPHTHVANSHEICCV